MLQRLLHDRELQLYDGSRLVSQDKFSSLQTSLGLTAEELEGRGVRPIHPAFRLVALAEPPTVGQAKGQWMTPEVLPMFCFHEMRPLSQQEEGEVLGQVAGASGPVLEEVLRATHRMRASQDPSLRSIAGNLSTRQLLRIARRLQKFDSEDAYTAVQKASLARFLPSLARESLEKELERLGIVAPLDKGEDWDLACRVEEGSLTIGSTSATVFQPVSGGEAHRIPYTVHVSMECLQAPTFAGA